MLPFLTLPTEDLLLSDIEKEFELEKRRYNNQQSPIIENSYNDELGGGGGIKKLSPWTNTIELSTEKQFEKLDENSAASLLYYIENNSKTSKKTLSSVKRNQDLINDTNFLGKIANTFGILTKEMVMNMRKSHYIEYGITIRALIKRCKISISDLKKAGILCTFQDLIDLKFTFSDLVINRKLFSVNHLYPFYGMNYSQLMKNELIDFNIFVLIDTKFTVDDLKTLGFIFDDFIMRDRMTKNHFNDLPYSFTQLLSLGLTSTGIKKLRMNSNDAESFGWPKDQFRQIRDNKF
jgi:hypothetical protein